MAISAEAAEVAKLSAALVRAETRASDAEARDAASVQTVTATRTELEAMAAKIAELELSAEAAFVERARTGKETERLEGELTEAETAKETLEGTVAALEEAVKQGVQVVVSTRAGSGRVTQRKAMNDRGFIAADNLNPQKARILLMLALTRTSDRAEIIRMFAEY